MSNTMPPIPTTLALVSLLTAGAAAAQVAPAPTATPVPIPAAPVIVLPTPTPSPTPTLALPPVTVTPAEPAPRATPRPRAEPQTPPPAPAARATASPTPVPPPAAVPTPEASASPTPTASPAVQQAPAVAREADQSKSWSWWWLAVPIAVAIAALAAWRALRRPAEPDFEEPFEPEAVHAADVPSTPDEPLQTQSQSQSQSFAEPAPTPTAVAELPSRRLELSFQPRRAGLNLLSALVEGDLHVTNVSAERIDHLRVDATLTSAHSQQDADLAAIYAATPPRPAAPPFALEPGETRAIPVIAAMPREAIRAMTLFQRQMFVPLIAISCRYAIAGQGAQTTRAFAIGIGDAEAAKLAPFWLDGPPRMADQVSARAHGDAAER